MYSILKINFMLKIKVVILILAFILASRISFANIIINEVMYSPNQCSDNYCEWVELYNPTNQNISLINWTICGDELLSGYVNHTDSEIYLNTTMTIFPFGYVIVTDGGSGTEVYDNFSVTNESIAFHVSSSSICGVLSNTGGTINLSNGNYSDIFIYDNSMGANGDGYTLEKINPNGTNSQENWGISLIKNGTPGYQNSIYGTGEIDYSQIEISEFLPDPEGYDDAPMPDGEWIELYNPTNTAMDLKWMFFKDLFGHSLYITDTTVSSTTTILSKGYLVVYTNGKSGLLNNNGSEILMFYDKSGNNLKNISYDGAAEGHSYAYVEGIGWQHTKPTPGKENINYSSVKDSNFKIIDVYDLDSDKEAKFGQTIRVEVNAYKGNDTKNVVRMWVADEDAKISKESKISIYARFTNYTLAVPIQLKPNCNEEYDDGDYNILIGWASESLAQDSFPLKVKGITSSLCEEVKVEEKKTRPGEFSYEIIEMPHEIGIGEKFDLAIRLDNNDNNDMSIKVWSYVFRGPKSYSGDRDENQKEFVLKGRTSDIVELSNIVDEAEPGDYRLKVVINKDNQKTNKEVTEDVKIKDNKISLENKSSVDNELGEILQENKITQNAVKEAGIVYESTTEKAKNLVLVFLTILSVILNVVLIWRR